MQKESLELLASKDVQAFIRDHERSDERDLVLRSSRLFGMPSSLIAEQIAGRKKARLKIPAYFNTEGIIYPPTLNLEQASSEKTAQFKIESLFSRLEDHELLVDLTGGFGVDSFFFSKKFSKVIYVEPDHTVLEIARHNHRLLGATNIEYRTCSAEEFLSDWDGHISAIYADPSRRSEGGHRVHGLIDCAPDVLGLQQQILSAAKHFIIKASPLLDISAAIRELSCVASVIIVAVDNDCKELLFACSPRLEGDIQVLASNLLKDRKEEFTFTFAEERESRSIFASPRSYIYEPNVAILKAGAFRLVGQRFGLEKLDVSTHLYTSEEMVLDFPGRIFKVDSLLNNDPKSARQNFRNGQANILIRNYPASVDDLKKKLKIAEGGDNYLLAATASRKKILMAATRLK